MVPIYPLVLANAILVPVKVYRRFCKGAPIATPAIDAIRK